MALYHISCATLATLCVLVSGACFPWSAKVDLGHYPTSAEPLRYEGLHRVSFSVEVRDRRGTDSPLEVGRRRGSALFKPPVRSRNDPVDAVRRAIIEELRVRDLRVQPIGQGDVLLRVELEGLFVSALESGRIRGHVQGVLEVVDTRSGQVVVTRIIEARSRYDALLLTSRKYEWALNSAIGDFAGRVVRHPDGLIAVQTIAARRELKEMGD